MASLRKTVSARERAAALIIVLAFVVLLTGLVIAYFSRATSDRPVAHSSFNQSKADELAASAMDNIIGDLRQEIVNGSSPSPTPSPLPVGFVLVPTSAANMLPQRSGNLATVPNLIRRSVRSDPILAPGIKSRASFVNSTTDVSVNGRSVSSTRWNSHYLIPKKNTLTDDSIPIDAFGSATPPATPDWVIVTRASPTPFPSWDSRLADPTTNNTFYAIGRYAYAIYDEGGLLDMNLAGNPTGTTVAQSGGKSSLAFADLTGLPCPIPNSSPGPYYRIDTLVGWRNYATTQPTGSFPISTFANNFRTSSTPATNFYNYVVNNPMGPLTVSTATSNGQTDQMFVGRKELIAFGSAAFPSPTALPSTTPPPSGTPFPLGTPISSTNALQYLGTFSREAAAGIPQWTGPSPTPTSVNPNFQTLLVTTSFTRNDGTTANVGDPLVNKPFLLQRLNWLTYKGPSGPSTANPSGRGNSSDNDIKILENTYGVTSAFLQQGTDANILKYFGLAWDTTNERWNYVGHGGSISPISAIATFGVGGTQAATREPDFFELLQAGLLDYSIGDSYSPISALTLPTVHQQSKMLHLLTIGANLIAQSRADSYPVRIACSVTVNGTPTIMEAIGAPRLPYLNGLAACPVGVTALSGGMNWFLIPNLWDPFRNTWDLTEAAGTPAYPRPLVRITVGGATSPPSIGGSGGSGSVGLGVTPTLPNNNSGMVPPVTPFAPVPIPFSPFPTTGTSGLAIGNVTTGTPAVVVGRDGFLQAMRLGSSDFTTAPSTFTPTTLGGAPSWNTIARPAGDAATAPRSDNYVVFRISSSTTLPTTGYPVLILNTGFQMTMDYKSPNGTWYSYSFLQGNNATNTWISTNATNLSIATNYSQYFKPTTPVYTAPTVCNPASGPPTLWTGGVTPGIAALAAAPMFAKADPRSIRYNSQIGVVNLASPPMSSVTAGIIGSIWPDAYKSPTYVVPPVMTTASAPVATPTPYSTPYPTPTPTPNANPAINTQISSSGVPDNALAASNPYSEATPGTLTTGDAVRPLIMNRPFRSVGEMGYAFRDQPFRTLSFSSGTSNNPSPDAGLLDLFSVIDYPRPTPTPSVTPTPTSTPRAGVINLNSRQGGAIAAMIASTIRKENAVAPSLAAATDAINSGTIFASLTTPVINKAGLATLIANASPSPSPSVMDPAVPKTERESIARALGEADQTRTWNLLIDVIVQSGRYPPNASALANFVVEGEQRYWVHVAIDRFTNQVIYKQIEVVNE